MTTIYITRVHINVLEAVSHKKFPFFQIKSAANNYTWPPKIVYAFLGVPKHLRYNMRQFPIRHKVFCKILTLYGSYNWK